MPEQNDDAKKPEKPEPRIVVDTNVLISAFGWKMGNEAALVRGCLRREFCLIISPDTIEEFREVARRPKFQFPPTKIATFTERILEVSELVIPERHFDAIADDPDDNLFLDVAVAGQADYIISGDRHLKELKRFKDIRILSTRNFFRILKGD